MATAALTCEADNIGWKRLIAVDAAAAVAAPRHAASCHKFIDLKYLLIMQLNDFRRFAFEYVICKTFAQSVSQSVARRFYFYGFEW